MATTDTYTMSLTGADYRLVASVVNDGIDARLEAFTRSTFQPRLQCMGGARLECEIHPAEMSILLRRLCERYDAGDDAAGDLAGDIVQTWHDVGED